jgi:hypothetical protein
MGWRVAVGLGKTTLLLVAVVIGCQTTLETPPAPVDAMADREETGRHEPEIEAVCSQTLSLGDPVFVVPSPGLPAAVEPGTANNNLDVVEHEGRTYLAFRSAKSHFADANVSLHVVSSTDRLSWDHELTLHVGADLREPRFLSLESQLMLFYAVLGDNPMDFQPAGMMVTTMNQPGAWTTPQWSYLEGFIPWRTRVVEGVGQMLGYVGGEDIYDTGESQLAVHWLRVAGPQDFAPMVPEQPVVLQGGVSETDVAVLANGNLVAVARNEHGDAEGFGSKVCTATGDAPGKWNCSPDPKKYDSPLLFTQGDKVFLVGRRNVTESGHYDLGKDELPPEDRFLDYQLDYWETPKRCAIWEVHPESRTVSFVVDLPSAGDTCFPAMVRRSPNTVEIWNYTSPLESPDISWFEGQTGPTAIYRLDLTFGCLGDP